MEERDLFKMEERIPLRWISVTLLMGFRLKYTCPKRTKYFIVILRAGF